MHDPIVHQPSEDLKALREEIDALDRELVERLAARAALIDRAVAIKSTENIAARLPDRVEDVVRRVRRNAHEQGLDEGLVETLWRIMIEWSIAREEAAMSSARGDENDSKDN